MIPCGTKWWPLQNPSVPTKTHPKNTVWGGVWTPKTNKHKKAYQTSWGTKVSSLEPPGFLHEKSKLPIHQIIGWTVTPMVQGVVCFTRCFFFAFRVLQSLTVGTTPWKLNSFSHDFFSGRTGANLRDTAWDVPHLRSVEWAKTPLPDKVVGTIESWKYLKFPVVQINQCWWG